MFFDWPDGLLFLMTQGVTERLRRAKFDSFMRITSPGPLEKILDVGVSGCAGRSTDFLEMWYPFKENLVALGRDMPDKFRSFRTKHPAVRLIVGDGLDIPCADDEFDVVFSNAVVEHVGCREKQRRFVHECVRVGERGFITTPNRNFPLDCHTMLPLAHLLPGAARDRIYRAAGKAAWCDRDLLNPLNEEELLALFPAGVRTTVYRQKLLGMTATIWVYFEKKRSACV